MTRTIAQLALLAVFALSACPKPPPGPGEPQPHPSVIACGTKAIATCAPQVLPDVNECLSSTGDVTTCLLGKIGACATYEVIACLVRHEGQAAEHAAQANHDDTRDARRAARAKEFISKQGVQFSD